MQLMEKLLFKIARKWVADNGSERTFSDSTVNRSRTGDKISLARHDKGLSTVINHLNKDASGNPLSAPMKASVTQMRKWDSRSQQRTLLKEI
ncbi:Transcription initiation factor IIB protein [Marine Group I thaumarchaeote SCGC AAA799-N04]|uniref:Transcription initiation factor IIB protein n=1 Tax=Marine Group I thaumarchaeote SCGC AAA799-N04 TaxID=1502293 RepID=A0A081RPE7_9ARCH|nr:Transcription initiation factor IIB protein [Marine Group I thaumarchaeote SCGC AAA799-N04]